MLAWLVCFAAGGYAASQTYPSTQLRLFASGSTGLPNGSEDPHVVRQWRQYDPRGSRSHRSHRPEREGRPLDDRDRVYDRGSGRIPKCALSTSSILVIRKFVQPMGRTTYAYLFTPASSGLGADPRTAATEASVAKGLPGRRRGAHRHYGLEFRGFVQRSQRSDRDAHRGGRRLGGAGFVFASSWRYCRS